MINFLLRRALQLIPTLIGISLISFFLMQLAPGGPIDQIADLNPHVTPEAKARIRHDMGLDRPIAVQYLSWVKHIVMLDFGTSFTDSRPVIKKIAERLPATLLLNFLAIGLMLLLAFPIGWLSALNANTFFDKAMTIFVFIGFSLPTYALALFLMIIFGLKLGWLPISGLSSLNFVQVPWWEKGWDVAKHLILPTLVLGLTDLAGLSRYTRNSLLEIIHQDYIRAARAKGLSFWRVYGVHAVRNALIPIVTLLGLMLPDLIGGGVIIETIFAYPGMGRLGYDAIMTRDYNLIMAITVISAALTVLGNFMADVLYAYADPEDPVQITMFKLYLERFLKNRLALAGFVVITFLTASALFSSRLTPKDPIAQDLTERLQGPSAQHWMGTDDLGRDVFSRLLTGTRVSLSVGFVAVGISLIVGVCLGLVAGFFGGWADLVIMRAVDVMLSIPTLFLILAVLAFLGPNIYNVMIIIGLTSWPGLTRLVRGECLSVREREYIQAARLSGISTTRLLFVHILPNVAAPILVSATLGVGGAILTESALSFLGLGVQPPMPSWGNILSIGRDYLHIAWWLSLFPTCAILITVLAFNLLGEGLRDVLDPRV